MAQFDIHENPSRTTKKLYPFLLDIQANHISELSTRIVIPLADQKIYGQTTLTRLTPEIAYGGISLLLMVPQLSSVESKKLKKPIGSLGHFRYEILAAIDFSISGI